jgi:MFS family permease
VVLAIQVLGLGGSGAGWLTAAFGGGGVVGVAATARFMVRSELIPAVLAGAMGWGAAFVALGLWPTTAGALVLLAVAGASRALVDVAGRTILQRVAPPDAIARVFGVLEALAMTGLAIGSIIVPPLVSVGGASAAVIGVGTILPAIAIAAGPRLLAIDRREPVPVVELALLRTAPIFAPLPPPTLVALARELRPVDVAPGTALIRQGEPGDRYYLIATGEFEIVQDGRPIAVRGRGEGLGEIALLRGVPRTATVIARTDARLYALERAPFLAVVTGHPPSTQAADRLISQRLETPADAQPVGPGPIGRS